ncbi:rna-directed dna polymerase from mobile element jockey-like [Willisornis vidua]|uniref:Rna-directed dna polymerase from mobile element jockey-like n=1 Tax=Willisornis vidua TaxID=1566151 RepID=A0ABQ9DKK1_9PASS|nr:rna-directed dna polymerase from mobile element jockey-like [Willisornis vidua]
MPGWISVMSAVPQGSVVGPGQLNIFVGDTDSSIKCTLGKFAGDTKLSDMIDTPERRNVIQRSLARLEKWACASIMKFSKASCKILHLCWGSPTLGNE